LSNQPVVFSLVLIFTGAAVMASLMLWTRQAMIIGYILAGAIIGPWGLGWLADTRVITGLAEIGIVFLLFLLGLDLTPQKLLRMFRATTVTTLLTSSLFLLVGWAIAAAFGFPPLESALAGIACMFSSTIIGIKLLPTTVLHHKRTGELMISILLIQDLVAILVMIGLQSFGTGHNDSTSTAWLLVQPLVSLPALIAVAFVLERWVLIKLFERFSGVQEYLFLLTIAWCLGLAQLAHATGLSYEIGAFVAGVVLASSPISQFIVVRLKPLRDFFLVLFFFALGAVLNLDLLAVVIWPALALAAAMLAIKPVAFALALKNTADSPAKAWETGFRLGQMSEFSLLITFLAMQIPGLGEAVILLIQVATVLTFIVSSSLVVLKFPTPVALDEKLRRD
jgi:Kef-type K+ transport system membrane component KefB